MIIRGLCTLRLLTQSNLPRVIEKYIRLADLKPTCLEGYISYTRELSLQEYQMFHINPTKRSHRLQTSHISRNLISCM
jgi:hypothetical protein